MARSRMRPLKAPTYLPCGCMAQGTRTHLNRQSITLTDGRKVCRHGRVWELSWVEAVAVLHQAALSPRPNRALTGPGPRPASAT